MRLCCRGNPIFVQTKRHSQWRYSTGAKLYDRTLQIAVGMGRCLSEYVHWSECWPQQFWISSCCTRLLQCATMSLLVKTSVPDDARCKTPRQMSTTVTILLSRHLRGPCYVCVWPVISSRYLRGPVSGLCDSSQLAQKSRFEPCDILGAVLFNASIGVIRSACRDKVRHLHSPL